MSERNRKEKQNGPGRWEKGLREGKVRVVKMIEEKTMRNVHQKNVLHETTTLRFLRSFMKVEGNGVLLVASCH